MQALNHTPPTKPVVSVLGSHTASFSKAPRCARNRYSPLGRAETRAPRRFEPAVAIDGVDEMMELWIPYAFKLEQFGGKGETIQLEGIDSDASWLITVQTDRTDGVAATTEPTSPRVAGR